MGEVGSNEVKSEKPAEVVQTKPESAKKPSLKDRIRGLLSRNKTSNTTTNSSPEASVPIPEDSGYQKLMQTFDKSEAAYDSTIPGHKYTGEQIQKMFANVYPDLVQKLSGTSSSTSSIEQLSQLHDGDIVTIYDTLGRIQTDLEVKLPDKNKTASPYFLKVSQINILRNLLQEKVESIQKEELQKKLKEAIKSEDPKVPEIKPLLNPLADKEIEKVLAGNKKPDPLLDQEKREE